MKYIPYSELEDAFSESCFPEFAGLDSSQKQYFYSYVKDSYTEAWNRFDWDFTLDIEETKVEKGTSFIDCTSLKEAGESRILQVWDGHPLINPNARNLSFKRLVNTLYFPKAINAESVFIKYKRNVPLLAKNSKIPLALKSMILALCRYRHENAQQRSDVSQVFLADYERYAQVEIQKQSMSSIRSNSINTRNIQ